MTTLMILLALALVIAVSVETLRVVLRDESGRPPRSHFEDPQFCAPGRI